MCSCGVLSLKAASLSSTGFVDLQTEKADLMENVGAIPFLDYKHFASRIFFPEVQSNDKDMLSNTNGHWYMYDSCFIFQNEALTALCIKDIDQVRFKTSCCWLGDV